MPAAATRNKKDRYRLFEAKPALGGNLVTRGSADNATIVNYTIKRDFRRDLDQEIRREGYDYFWPNLNLPIGGQPFPSLITIDFLFYTPGIGAVATRLSGHWFEVGETIIITGANDALYNGAHVITAVTPTAFVYQVAGVPNSPDTGTAIFSQADEVINLEALARRPNGQTAVIAGSQRRLYRYFALEDPDYISRDPADYPAGTPADQLSYWSDGTLFPGDQVPPQPPGFWGNPNPPIDQMQYVDTNPGYWIVIGSGFSSQGRRWEVISINGYMVFNNGIDLPCTYRVEEMSVVPIYEMREQGISRVGTIGEIDGILMIGDLSEIHSASLIDWFQKQGSPVQLDSLTYAADIVTATRAAGITYLVGQRVTITGATHPDYNGTFRILTVTPTTFTYEIPGAPLSPDPSTAIFSTGDPYIVYPYDQNVDRTTFRIGWGVPGEPRRWGPLYTGSIAAFSNVLTLTYAVKGLTVGMDLTITGAGAAHAGGTADNLTGNILFVNDTSVILDTFAKTTVTNANVQATDMIGAIIGYEDLQDDGSGILKMLALADQLVIYKDSSIFLGQYLGTVDQPFAFSPRRIQKEQSLYYRNTLSLVETPTEMFHIYCGRNAFYRFDLTNQQPMVLPKFEACSNVFYDLASLAQTESIFVTENGITHELMWFVPGAIDNLCWDYKWDSHATTTMQLTAGATVRKPITGQASGAEQDWYILGTGHGAVLLYGLTNEIQAQPDWNNRKSIFFRRDSVPYDGARFGYDSVLSSGLGSFGNDYLEKDIRSFVVLLSSQSPNTPVNVDIFSAQNPNSFPVLIASKFFPNPIVQNMLPLLARRYYLRSVLTVSGLDNPFRLDGTIWNVAAIDSRSFGRA